jgi:hypothetical protein
MPRKSKNSGSPSPEERYWMIESLLDKGFRPSDIARVIEQKGGITLRQAQRDIQRVRENRNLSFSNVANGLAVQMYHRSEYLYQESVKKGDYQLAAKILTLQNDLIQKQNLTRGGNPYALSDSTGIPERELEALLAALSEDRLAE